MRLMLNIKRNDILLLFLLIAVINATGKDKYFANPQTISTDIHSDSPHLHHHVEAGEQWQLQTTLPGNPPLYNVRIVSKNIAWIVGDARSDIYRTVNGGQTWQNKTTVTTNTTLSPVLLAAVDSNIAFVGTASHTGKAAIFRTRDGGQTWQQVYQPPRNDHSYWNWIHFFDAQNGIAECDQGISGQHFFVVKTSNGGDSWTPIANQPTGNVNEYGANNSVCFYDSQHGWFGTGPFLGPGVGGRVFRTVDGGETWTGYASGNPEPVTGVSFISPLVGVRVSLSAPHIARTTDGGQTWEPVSNLPVSNIRYVNTSTAIHTAVSSQMWASGDAGSGFTPFILTSIDSGASWHTQTMAGLSGNSINNMMAITHGTAFDSVQAFAISGHRTTVTGGQILNYLQPVGIVTGVAEENPVHPDGFVLSQNYPNPFNPVTTIRFEVSEPAQVSLEIYNSLGQFVRTLINRRMAPGEYREVWDGRNDRGDHVASGIYVYRLQTENYIASKQMVLLH